MCSKTCTLMHMYGLLHMIMYTCICVIKRVHMHVITCNFVYMYANIILYVSITNCMCVRELKRVCVCVDKPITQFAFIQWQKCAKISSN